MNEKLELMKWLYENGVEPRRVPGFDNYAITQEGRLFSFNTNIPKERKFCLNKSTGRYQLPLYKSNKAHTFSRARLVALCWVDNPGNKPYVNHIDGNKINDEASNLEWVTMLENNEHASKNGLNLAREIIQLSLDGVELKRYSTIAKAAKATGVIDTSISRTCRGHSNTAGGFIWKYGANPKKTSNRVRCYITKICAGCNRKVTRLNSEFTNDITFCTLSCFGKHKAINNLKGNR